MNSIAAFLKRGLILVLLTGVSACSSISSSDFNPGAIVSGGRDLEAEKRAAERYAAVAVCPEVQLRDGTQLMRFYEKGKKNDLGAVRFQGTLQKYARECRPDGLGGTLVKVGVAGRVLAGPSGATGTVDLPVRVVVVKNGDEVLYSQIHKVGATLSAGQSSVLWTKVVDNVAIPAQDAAARFVIYVGFDESGKP